jgi:dihydrofolate synthase/folylpolyglutamate synthase
LINAATAVATLEVLARQSRLELTPEQIKEGLANTKWSGRLEWLSTNPAIILDGAHNYAGAVALRQTLKKEYSYRRLIVVFGIMADKDLRGMLFELAPLAEHIILTKPRYERAANPESVLKAAGEFSERMELIKPVKDALERALALAGPRDLILITGSLYFIGEVKEIHEAGGIGNTEG